MGNVTFHIWKGLSTDFLPRLVSVGVWLVWHIKHRQWSHCLCAGQMCRCEHTTAPHKCNAVEMSNGVLIVLWDVRVGGLHATIASISNLSQMRWQVVVYIYIHKRAARLTMSYWREIWEESIIFLESIAPRSSENELWMGTRHDGWRQRPAQLCWYNKCIVFYYIISISQYEVFIFHKNSVHGFRLISDSQAQIIFVCI